mgnify:FL=1
MILLIDNYDSFVFNIKTMLNQLTNDEIAVYRNDKITLDEIKRLSPNAIILSPGPKHPKDSGVCLEIFKARLNVPVLGICLGHQALGLCFGAKIQRLKEVAHATSSQISLIAQSELFREFPKDFSVMRYHSLEVVDLPSELEALAYTKDKVLMAMRHKDLPYFGVQFHPESYFSEYGLKIFENFLKFKGQTSQKTSEKPTLTSFITKLQDNQGLNTDDFARICQIIASREYEAVQLGALLVLITEKSLDERSLSALVSNILKYSQTFNDESEMIDIVGTGGDGFKSINVSTTTAFILGALGVKVAKHGNRAISSASGSSDVLSALKIPAFDSIAKQVKVLDEQGLTFFHAPFFHSLVGEVKEVRAKLGVRTVFNVLGPLLHPNLSLKYQLMGNYHAPVHRLLIEVLRNLGRKHALVVRGNDGMDEISICDETSIYELKDGQIFNYTISPEQFGFKRAFHSEIVGGDAKQNAKILLDTLSGKQKGAKFDIVVLNAMFALYTANRVPTPAQAKDIVLEAIHSGKVIDFFNAYQSKVQGYDKD